MVTCRLGQPGSICVRVCVVQCAFQGGGEQKALSSPPEVFFVHSGNECVSPSLSSPVTSPWK